VRIGWVEGIKRQEMSFCSGHLWLSCLSMSLAMKYFHFVPKKKKTRNEVSTATDISPILVEVKNILLISVCFTDFGEASSFCGRIADTWKSALIDRNV